MTPSEIDQLLVKKAKGTHIITKQLPAADVSFVFAFLHLKNPITFCCCFVHGYAIFDRRLKSTASLLTISALGIFIASHATRTGGSKGPWIVNVCLFFIFYYLASCLLMPLLCHLGEGSRSLRHW
jgi:hypothetical protein